MGYNTSKALAEILVSMFVEYRTSRKKISRGLAEFMKDFTIAEDEEFVSHDVVALFTNTPTLETLEYIN